MKIILKSETSLGLESHEELGFNSEEELELEISKLTKFRPCLLYTSPSPRDRQKSRMPSSA